MLGAMQWGMNVHNKSQSTINRNRDGNRNDKSRSAKRCGFCF